MITKEELLEKLNIATEEQLEEFLKLPVFNSEYEGLLFIMVRLMKENTKEDLMESWGASESLAEFLLRELVVTQVVLGGEDEDAA